MLTIERLQSRITDFRPKTLLPRREQAANVDDAPARNVQAIAIRVAAASVGLAGANAAEVMPELARCWSPAACVLILVTDQDVESTTRQRLPARRAGVVTVVMGRAR